MGAIGRGLGGLLGKAIGGFAGNALGKFTGTGGQEGGEIGETLAGNLLGKLIPFKKGGRVRKTGPAYMHKGEFVLPKGVKPTTKQLKAVSKRRGRKCCRKSRR